MSLPSIAPVRAVTVAATTAAAALAVAGCGGGGSSTAASGNGGGGPAQATVKVAVIEGRQFFPIEVMQQHGIAAKHHLTIQATKLAAPPALYTQMRSPSFEVGFGAWPEVADIRAGGVNVQCVYSVDTFTDDVMVKSGSPLHSLGDLKGKDVGLFGGPASGTTLMLRLEAKKFYGVDLAKDAHLHSGAAALLGGELDKGDLDAALLLDPEVDELLAGGGYRSIADLGALWKAKTGQVPLDVCITMNGDWASKNPSAARRFVAAYRDAVLYLKAHPEAWPALSKSVGIKSAKGSDLLRKRSAQSFVTRWDDSYIAQQQQFAHTLARTLGPIQGFPQKIAAGTFTTAYAPKGGTS